MNNPKPIVPAKPFPAAAIVQTKGRQGVRLVPIQAADFYQPRAAALLPHTN